MKKVGGAGTMKWLVGVCLAVNVLLIVAVVVIFIRADERSTTTAAPTVSTDVTSKSVSSGTEPGLTDAQKFETNALIDTATINLKRVVAPLYEKLQMPWASTFSYVIENTEYARYSFDYPEPATIPTNHYKGEDQVFGAALKGGSLYVTASDVAKHAKDIQEKLDWCASAKGGASKITISGVEFCRYPEGVGGMETSGRAVHFLYVGKETALDLMIYSGSTWTHCDDYGYTGMTPEVCAVSNAETIRLYDELVSAISRTLKVEKLYRGG